jgi:hypothetical protein
MDLQAKLDFAKKVNPEYEKALKGYIGTGGLIIGKQLQTSFLRSGGAERDVAMRMNRMSMQDFIRESIGVGQRVKGRVDPYARVLDESSSIIGSGITGYYDLANLKEEDIKKLQQGIQQNRENRDSETAQLADTSTALQRAGVNLQQLAVGVDVAKDAMSSFAGVIETLTSKLKTYFGAGKTSAGSSNASASGVAVEGAGAANANAVMEGAAGGAQVPADTPVTGGTSSRPISRSMGMPGMMPTSADASDMETTPAGFSDRERDLPHYVNMFEWGSGDARMTRFALLDENLKKNMTRAARDYYELTGRKLIFRSGLRTKEEQKLLYDRWIKKGKTGYPVAKPGQSRHESGFSLDINDDQADFLDRKGILAKYGLDRPVRNDPVHIELSGQRRPGGRKRVQEAALGGIVEAVAGGRQLIAAEAGMNEAFVPLPDGKTIPVTMSENGVFGDIKSLLSDIRGLLESGNGIYRKQMMIARN